LRLLLDTHALLWWATESTRLPPKVVRALRKEQNDVYVSAATPWEITTKVRLGKLTWPPEAGPVTHYVMAQGFTALPITLAHAERAGSLLFAHRDPFDRMLIAQSLLEDLLLVSNEELFDAVGARRYW
jgi:PIN domain nuclease of toxin-antitoxin system